ncbi:MAG: hypothetical protein J6K76_01945 [Spirochaetaceae bacterium]|nr:hypothetical protein [Spirochaetaceae bacterium]
MKKLLCTLFIFSMLSVLYAFKIADKFYIDRLGYTGSVFITKVHEDIYFVEGIGSGAKFEKRRIEDFILDADGWYSTEIFGEKTYCIFGADEFEFSSKNKMFTLYDPKLDFTALRKKWDSHPYHSEFSINNSPLKVPDYLVENKNGEKIIYNTDDMSSNVYARYWEGGEMRNIHAKPWATSKEPVGMHFQYSPGWQFDSLLLLNGYVDPSNRHLYKDNRRIKRIRITSPQSSFILEVEIEDVVHFHEIPLPESVREVDIEILDFYEGRKYKDLCIQRLYDYLDMNTFNYYGDYSKWTDKDIHDGFGPSRSTQWNGENVFEVNEEWFNTEYGKFRTVK